MNYNPGGRWGHISGFWILTVAVGADEGTAVGQGTAVGSDLNIKHSWWTATLSIF